MKEKFYTLKQAAEMLNIHVKTLQRWDNEGKIDAIRTPSNRRKFSESEINRILQQGDDVKVVAKNTLAIYGRVSSHDQKKKGDLDRQVGYILSNINSESYESIKTITDVGSGLNDKRKGLIKLMDMAKDKEIQKIAITYKDRLTRFGFNYLEKYFNSHDVEIVIMNDKIEDKSPHEELMDDLMSIIASFSGKLYGLRSRKNKVVEEKVKGVFEDALHIQSEDIGEREKYNKSN